MYIINHVSAEKMTTVRMIPLGTNKSTSRGNGPSDVIQSIDT
jgi:hypothetical protein